MKKIIQLFVFEMKSYHRGLKIGLGSTDIEVFKLTVFEIILLITCFAILLHFGLVLVIELFYRGGLSWSDMISFIVFLSPIVYLIGSSYRKNYIIAFSKHLFLSSLVIIAFASLLDYHDATVMATTLVLTQFLIGFITRARVIFLYSLIIIFIIVCIYVAEDFHTEDFFELEIVVFAATFFAITSAFLVWSLENVIRRNQEMTKEINDVFHHDRKIYRRYMHKLKTPLTSMKLLLSQSSSGKGLDIESMSKFTEEINNSIEALNKVSKARLSSLSPKRGHIDMHKFISKVVEDAKVLARSYEHKNGVKRNIYLDIGNVKERDKAYLAGDQIREVLLHVIDNCICHSPRKEIVNIRVSINKTIERFTIIVEDDGKGIDSSMLEEIKEKDSFVDAPVDYGIGLLIARRLIRANYGTMKISSGKGKGTKIKIVLPVY